MSVIHLPDEMGIHDDMDGTIWLARQHYPLRQDARRWFMDFTGCTFLEARVTVDWMRFQPLDWEELWVRCKPEDPGAFKCWRLETT